jgi:hypothetical protein
VIRPDTHLHHEQFDLMTLRDRYVGNHH